MIKLFERFRLMRWTTHDAIVSGLKGLRRQEINSLNQKHAEELEAIKEQVGKIIERCSRITFDHREDRYSIQLEFSPRMFGIGMRDEIELIAEEMAYRVRAEIASCRFIQSSRELERERLGVGAYFKGKGAVQNDSVCD